MPGNKVTKSKDPPPDLEQEGNAALGITRGVAGNVYKDGDAVQPRASKDPSWTVDIILPRRSFYVMYGDARIHWKHCIRPMISTYGGPQWGDYNRAWNPDGQARSTTFRSTKIFSDVQ